MSGTCPQCHAPISDASKFCTSCGAPTSALPVAPAPQAGSDGHAVAASPADAHAAAQWTAGQPAAGVAWGAQGYPAPPGAPPPTGPFPAAYGQQPPPPSSSGNRMLIIGLIAALAVVVVGAIAAVLLSSGDKNVPLVATGSNVAATQAASAAPVRTVVTVVRQATKHHNKSAGSSSSPVTATARPVRPRATSAIADKAEITGVVKRHWANIESGNYTAAFDALAPGTQNESSWISAHESDDVTSASISLGSPTLTSATTATVPVITLHTEANSGCNDWSGHYEMVKVGGDWRIGKAKIVNSPC